MAGGGSSRVRPAVGDRTGDGDEGGLAGGIPADKGIAGPNNTDEAGPVNIGEPEPGDTGESSADGAGSERRAGAGVGDPAWPMQGGATA